MTEPLDPTTLKQLNSPEATELHQLLKELSHTGVERLVDLPRIVVYGAQNSGKSSVLEALTHLHFPVNTGLCTRFATELQLKQASKLRIQASVKFHDNRTSKAISDAGFEESDLPAIIEKAKDEMGLTEPNSSISRDILCLDIEGPEFFPLQLVDLPGVFSQESQGQTKEDMATVNELVESYTKQTNTIIMMIVSAQIDYHSQSFAKALEKFDFKRERTLGVITKPDIAMANDRNGETIFQSPYVTLAENRQPGLKLDLGWHVLRNRGPQEESSSFEARDETETRFFRESICWAKFLGVNRAGIKALRVELSKIQFNHLKKSMPGIIEQMKTGLAACQAELAQMGGTERQKPGELRSYLAFKAAGFESLAKDAINGKYTDVFFENSPSHFKLRAQLRNFNDALAYTLRVKGATEAIVTPSFEKPAPFNLSASLRRFLSENEYPFSDPTVVTLDTVSGTLNKDEAENRGLEFPDSMNGSTIVNLFQRRSEKWEAIAKHHVDLVLRATREFVEGTLEYLFGPADPGTGTAYAITHIIVNEFFAERERLTKEKIDELVQPYKDGFARPVDSEFKKHMYRTMAVSRAAEVLSGQQPTLQGSAASDPAWADETVTVRWPFLHSLMSNSFDEKTDGVAIRGSTLDYVETYYEVHHEENFSYAEPY